MKKYSKIIILVLILTLWKFVMMTSRLIKLINPKTPLRSSLKIDVKSSHFQISNWLEIAKQIDILLHGGSMLIDQLHGKADSCSIIKLPFFIHPRL